MGINEYGEIVDLNSADYLNLEASGAGKIKDKAGIYEHYKLDLDQQDDLDSHDSESDEISELSDT